MKYAAVLVCFALILSGCTWAETEMDRAMALRSTLLDASTVEFHVQIVADYGDEIQTFEMNCIGDRQGNLSFAVTEPKTISGITGTISQEGGKLTFDNTAVFFDLLTDDQLSPISAPWIFLKTMRSGYIRTVGREDELFRLTVDDSYDEDALQLDIWFNDSDTPERADILYDGKRILSLIIEAFVIQ